MAANRPNHKISLAGAKTAAAVTRPTPDSAQIITIRVKEYRNLTKNLRQAPSTRDNEHFVFSPRDANIAFILYT